VLNLAAQRGRRGTVCAKRAFGTTKFWCIDRSDSCFLFVVCQRGLSVEPVYKVHACARRCGCNTVLRLLLEYIMQRRCQPEATDRRWHVCCGGLGRDLSHSPEGMLDSATATLGPQTDGPGPSALNASTPHMSYTPTAPPLRLQSPRLQPRKPPSGLYIFIDVFQYLFLFSPGVRLSLRLVLSRPPGLQMHARPKADYTHSRGRLHDIARQNHALASKLQTISLTPSSSAPAAAHVPQYLKVASVAPAAINRKKKQTNIEKENARLLARLQSVKPDKSLNSKKLAQDHQLHQKFSQNCRKVKLRPEWQE